MKPYIRYSIMCAVMLASTVFCVWLDVNAAQTTMENWQCTFGGIASAIGFVVCFYLLCDEVF